MIVALLAAFGIFVILLRSHRPEEGWLPWTREAFAARGTDVADAEPVDLSLTDLMEDAEPGSGYTTLEDLEALVRR